MGATQRTYNYVSIYGFIIFCEVSIFVDFVDIGETQNSKFKDA